MTHADVPAGEEPTRPWLLRMDGADQCVESVELRNGVRLILSRFEARASARIFSFTEPEDMFGFGFHLLDGAYFEVETIPFETRALDVWACATPRGSTSRFVLPSGGFRTVAIRFEPGVAGEYFDGGQALPRGASGLFRRARESAGVARLNPMAPVAAERLKSMFATGYGGAARRLYLESCALDLLAGLIGEDPAAGDPPTVLPRHRQSAMAAREYLELHFQHPPSIPELARIVGTNEFTLKRAFKALFGTTLYGYVSTRRMEQAKLLLRQGMPVASTAHAVGYECVRSFSAAFRRQTGQSPSSARRVARSIAPDRR